MQELLTILTDDSIEVFSKANIGMSEVIMLNTQNTSKLTINAEEIYDIYMTTFEYLERVINVEDGTKSENRLKKARASYAMPWTNWLPNSINMFYSCLKSTLLYDWETWFVTNKLTKQLKTLINKYLRYIL